MTAAAVGVGLPHRAVSSGLSQSSCEVCILDHPGGARHGTVTHHFGNVYKTDTCYSMDGYGRIDKKTGLELTP